MLLDAVTLSVTIHGTVGALVSFGYFTSYAIEHYQTYFQVWSYWVQEQAILGTRNVLLGSHPCIPKIPRNSESCGTIQMHKSKVGQDSLNSVIWTDPAYGNGEEVISI